MAKPLSILFCASEIFPFAKTGGLADVAYGLPLALRDLGHDIRVMLPKYGPISERRNRIHEINRLKDLPIPVGELTEPATVKSSSIVNPRTKVQAYMTTNHRYFDSKWGVYSDPETGLDYEDNDERFIFFSRTVIETCMLLGWFPDVVHCNDWHTGLIPVYMREMFPEQFADTKIVFTIHNIANQGDFDLDATFPKAGFDEGVRERVSHNGRFNFLKAGLSYADHVTTVSPSYAREILENGELTDGLNDVLAARKDVFSPVLNGIDTTVWNPEKDKSIARKYTADSIDKKEANKEKVVESFGLNFKAGRPVIAMISRLVPHKGLSLLQDAADKLLEHDLQLLVLGEGDQDIQEFLETLQKDHPDKVGVKIGFDDNLAHLIEAGADMFLMPSLFEPCGLNQMYSFAYGTVPVVRATGGLKDTVREQDGEAGPGNGFVFDDYTAEAMLAAVARALEAYGDKSRWNNIVAQGMSEDHSWNKAAGEYEGIYRGLFEA